MNNNVIGRMTCPICGETGQDLKVNVNHKLYMFCDNGCSVKLNSAKSKRYMPVLLSGSDVKDDAFGLIISTCKGNSKNEIIKQKEVRNAGNITGANDNAGSHAGTHAGAGAGTGSVRSDIIRRADGANTTAGRAGEQSILGRAAAWLAADDDDE